MTAVGRSGRRGALVAFIVLALAMLACGPAPGGSGQAAPAARSSAAPVAGALDFSGTTLDGVTLDAATLAGTPVVAWFWAPW